HHCSPSNSSRSSLECHPGRRPFGRFSGRPASKGGESNGHAARHPTRPLASGRPRRPVRVVGALCVIRRVVSAGALAPFLAGGGALPGPQGVAQPPRGGEPGPLVSFLPPPPPGGRRPPPPRRPSAGTRAAPRRPPPPAARRPDERAAPRPRPFRLAVPVGDR